MLKLSTVKALQHWLQLANLDSNNFLVKPQRAYFWRLEHREVGKRFCKTEHLVWYRRTYNSTVSILYRLNGHIVDRHFLAKFSDILDFTSSTNVNVNMITDIFSSSS